MATGFYDARDVQNLTTLSIGTIWRMVRVGEFPQPIAISPRRRVWPRDIIDAWINGKVAAARDPSK